VYLDKLDYLFAASYCCHCCVKDRESASINSSCVGNALTSRASPQPTDNV
jgi:hypothetical protein